MINICRWFFLGLYTVFTIIPRYLYIGLMCLIDPKKGQIFKYKGKPIIPVAMIGLTLSVYLICIFFSTRWYVQRLKINFLTNNILENTKIIEDEEGEKIKKVEKTEDTTEEDTKEEKPYVPVNNNTYTNVSYISTDFNDLLRKNSDTVGWIKINNTNVNYSVVQSNDNEFYLKHDFNKRSNANGWIYGDYRDDFENFGTNTIIYGHNLINKTMFGSLTWALRESWYKNSDNWYIKLSTPTSNTVWKIFSIYQIKPEIYYLKTYFDSDSEHQEFLDTLKGRSIYDFGESLGYYDKILTLSTCSDDGTKRMVVHAKMIKAEYR